MFPFLLSGGGFDLPEEREVLLAIGLGKGAAITPGVGRPVTQSCTRSIALQ